MDKMKQTLVVGLVAVLVVLGGGWHFLVSPQSSKVNSLNADKATVDQANTGLQSKIVALKAQAVEGPAAQAALEAIALRLPSNLAEASLLKTLQDAAVNANVDLQSVSAAAPVAVALTAPTAVTPTTSSTAGTGGARAAAPAGSSNQLFSLPLTLSVSGDYFDVEMFVHNLEGMQRAVLISSLNFTKTGTDSSAATGSTGTSASVNGENTTTKNVAGKPGKAETSKKATAKGTKAAKASVAPKLVPGSQAAAQAAAQAAPVFVADANTLTVAIQASVFSMYSSNPIPPVTPTTAPPTK